MSLKTKNPQVRKSHRKSLIALAAAIPVLIGGALLLNAGNLHARPQPAQPALPEVTVAEVLHQPLHEWQEFTGRLQAVNTVEVRPRVSGYIDRVDFEDGARVKKGELLFQIDPRPFQAEVDRLVAERNRAVSDLTLARANYGRAQQLLASNAIAREEYERLGAAQSAAEGALGSVDGSLQAARLNLEFTQVRAPIDGHVSRALITAGNLVNSSSLLTTVVSDDPVYAYFDADEQTYLHYTRNGRDHAGAADEVFMGLVDEDGFPHKGRLDFVDNQVDPSTGTIRARAVLPNPVGRYTPGLFARIRLVGGDDRDTVLIEDRAVGTDLGKKFVLVLKPDDSIEYRLVQIGPAIDGLRVVEHGLNPGDVIVVNGLQHVRPGQTVSATRVAMNFDQPGLQQVAAGPASSTVSTSNSGHAQP